MGRAIIIKDADFSAVAVETIPVGGKYYLSKSNPLNVVNKYIDGSTQKWAQDSATALYVYPLSAGEVVTAKEYAYKCVMNMVDSIGAVGESVAYSDGNTSKISTGDVRLWPSYMPVSLKAQEDCLLIVYGYVSAAGDYFPSELYIEDAPGGERVLKPSDAVFTSKYYLKADGTWGTSGGDGPSFYYNVYAGDVVKVKAQAGHNTAIAFLDYNGFPGSGTGTFAANETGRHSVSAGSEESFTAPTDCVLYVYGTEYGVSSFPESLIINPSNE